MLEHVGVQILLFVSVTLLVGVILRQLLKQVAIPYTVALLIVGILFGLIYRFDHNDMPGLYNQTVQLVADIDPHLILFLFLPTLIFESAYAIETHLFKRTFSQIALLAVPGLIVCTSITAVFVKYVFPWDWSWPICFMFGALISATDPVAVVALLKELSSRKRLETLIEGESLLNDGTAIVLFTLFYSMLSASHATDITALGVIGDFTWVVSFGFLIGLAGGWLMILWIGKIFNDPLIEITSSIATAYLVFYIAEGVFHVSGVVAVVTLGVLLAAQGRTRISAEVKHFLHQFWELMAYLANTLIFVLVGIIVAVKIRLDDPQAWLMLAVLYIAILLIRGVSIISLSPLLKQIGIGLTKHKSLVLIWGGLRGAVALALALSVVQSDHIPAAIGEQILFLTAGIVVLTIIINGGTIRLLLTKLGLDKLPEAKQKTVDKAELHIQFSLQREMEKLRKDDNFSSADWNTILQHEHIQILNTEAEINHLTDDEHELIVAYKRRILEAEKRFYWYQFDQGMMNIKAVETLNQAVEHALDGEPKIYPRKEIYLEPIDEHNFELTFFIAHSFIQAQKSNWRHLSDLEAPKHIYHAIADELKQNIEQMQHYLNAINQFEPERVKQIQTLLATRVLLNKRRHKIEDLAEQGVLEPAESEKLLEDIDKEIHKLALG
ncbi:NhaP-type Na+/H+ and K+/H+ antiporter [Catenovulum agarivorans DS-2]|uniref:NhaP-type Na+/H+ and K+/H+ antiporter n=1 Tax=Catenovulum agarivorans DS-2 TaxID=1328313 RepID=W7QFK9_9ALTE|nr:sodium:proton antiporter [Catenovulum agarivorans]EWH11699.1 NhaP-type Na+/H+ and K+/H+ antiporter [Catenovulum agarivorans DS-2]